MHAVSNVERTEPCIMLFYVLILYNSLFDWVIYAYTHIIMAYPIMLQCIEGWFVGTRACFQVACSFRGGDYLRPSMCTLALFKIMHFMHPHKAKSINLTSSALERNFRWNLMGTDTILSTRITMRLQSTYSVFPLYVYVVHDMYICNSYCVHVYVYWYSVRHSSQLKYRY